MLHDPDELRSSPRGRFVAIALGALALAGLIYAALSTAWLVTGSGTGFGLRTFETCHALGCDARPIAELPAQIVAGNFATAGLVTWIASWVAVGALGAAMIPMFVGARVAVGRIASRLALLALVVALAGAVWFVMTRPGTADGKSTYALSLGFWAFCAGNVLGLTAGQLLGKLHAPADPG